MIPGLLAGLLAAALFGLGAVLQAHAVRRQDGSPTRLGRFLLTSARDWRTLVVVASYLLGFVLHVLAIRWLPLYLAQAAVAMSLPVTAMTSSVLHERLSPVHWSAVGVVTTGLVLLAVGSGDPGPAITSTAFVTLLVMGTVVLGVVGGLGRHLHGGTLGGLAGLGYAGSAIGVRGVENAHDVLAIIAAVSVVVYGVLAFWLYSIALERAPVSASTAPLIAAETFVPALIGVALLGDGVRPGWLPVVVVGLVLSSLGAIALSRDQSPAAAELESQSQAS